MRRGGPALVAFAAIVLALGVPAARAVSAPVANDDHYTTPSDTTLTVAAPGYLANDTGLGGEVPLFLGSTSNGSFVHQSDGSFVYTPSAGFHGLDEAAYCLSSTSVCESAAAFISIQVVPPTAVADTYSMPFDTTLTVAAPGFLGNDSGVNPGEVPLFAAGAAHGSFVSQTDGSFVYTPTVGFHGVESLAYCVSSASICETPNVFIDITVVGPPPPVANDDSYSTPSDTPLTVTAPGFLANDTGLGGGEAPLLVGSTSNGTFSPQPDGSFVYTPNPGSHGLDEAAYCLSRSLACESAAAFIGIQVVPPVAVGDAYSMSMDTTLTLTAPGFLANDTGIAGGQVPQFAAGATHGSFVSQADGSFVYTPNAGFHGLETLAYCLSKASFCETPNVFIDITIVDPATTTTTTSTTSTSTTSTTSTSTTSTTSTSTTSTTTDPSTSSTTTDPSSTTTTSSTSSSTSTTSSSSTTSTTEPSTTSTTSTAITSSSTTSTTGPAVLPAVAGQDRGTTTSTSPDGTLPVTGGASLVLIEVGLGLVVVGIAAVSVNRRGRRSPARR